MGHAAEVGTERNGVPASVCSIVLTPSLVHVFTEGSRKGGKHKGGGVG